MSYIGKEPADSFISFAKQDFSTSATTSYTLDNAVANENELALFINFVRQEPTTAYTASGTTLTLTSATASSDDMYCVYLGQAKQTVNAPDGSVGSSQVASTIITGQTAETSIADSDTILIHDDSASALRKMTKANFVSGVGGDNKPAFRATMSADQDNISSGTNQKVAFNTETYDEGSCYDHSSNYRFTVPSGEGGKYLIIAHLHFRATNDYQQKTVRLFKNGSFLAETQHYTTGEFTESSVTQNCEIVTIENLSASDYIEVYGKSQGYTFHLKAEGSYFSACKLII